MWKIILDKIGNFKQKWLIEFEKKAFEDFKNLLDYYKNLYYKIYNKFYIFNKKEVSFWIILKWFLWLIFSIILWIYLIYPKFLFIKFLFFTLKYVLDYIYFFFDFFIDFFFKKSKIIKFLYWICFKMLYKILKFFILDGIPNIFSKSVWKKRSIKYQTKLLNLIDKILYIIQQTFLGFPDLRKKLYLKGLNWQKKITTGWETFIKNLKIYLYKIDFYIFFIKYHVIFCYKYVWWHYKMITAIFSKRGRFIWKKKYSRRFWFLVKNVVTKSTKFFIKFCWLLLVYNFSVIQIRFEHFFVFKYNILKIYIHRTITLRKKYPKEFIFHPSYKIFLSIRIVVCKQLLKIIKIIMRIQCILFAFIGWRPLYIDREDKIRDINYRSILKEFKKIFDNIRNKGDK